MMCSSASGWVSTPEGRHLSGRRKADTRPEVELRRALHHLGLRFRKNKTLARACTPDIVLPRWGTVIFVDGCFWHGCPEHGRKRPWTGPNAHRWSEKMVRNRERDNYATRTAEGMGWQVIRVWECQVTRDPQEVAARIKIALRAPHARDASAASSSVQVPRNAG